MKSIGCDIIKVDRLKSFLENKKKLERFFSESEILNVKSKGRKSLESLAGKFAAKEALLKALGSIVIKTPTYALKDIEVLNTKQGKAIFLLHNEIRNLVEKFNLELYLTISHEKEYAIAFVAIG